MACLALKKIMKKILIADQDQKLLRRLDDLLVKNWLVVEKVQNATSLYPVVNVFCPDLIIMEINLGYLDGRSFCNDMKSMAETAHIPIILLTTMSHREISAIFCEADAILGKPLNETILIQTISDLVIGSRQ